MTFAFPCQRKSSYSFLGLFLLLTTCFAPLAKAAYHPTANASSVAVTIDDIEVRAGETFQVVVNIGDVTGLEVTAFNIAFTYDASMVTATGATLEGTIAGPGAAEMTQVYNIQSGRVVFAAAGVTALTSAGSLVVFTFESLDQDGIVPLAFDALKLNEGDPEAIGTAGAITISSALKGDVTLNGEVTAYDAAGVLQHASFMDTLSVAAQLAADVSASNGITSYDAALILQRVADLISCFPSEDCPLEKKGAAKFHEVTAKMDWGIARPDGVLVHIPLMIDDIRGDVQAITVDVTTPEAQDVAYSIQSRLPDGWIVSHGRKSEDTFRISMAGISSLASDTLLVLQLNGASTALDTRVQFNEQEFETLERLQLGTVPDAFSLAQNYPNPFNPTTTIQYALQEDLPVSLIVYDLLGREVRRLVDEHQPAGTHAVSFDAGELSSGVYVYRLEAGAFTETRQMTLVK